MSMSTNSVPKRWIPPTTAKRNFCTCGEKFDSENQVRQHSMLLSKTGIALHPKHQPITVSEWLLRQVELRSREE